MVYSCKRVLKRDLGSKYLVMLVFSVFFLHMIKLCSLYVFVVLFRNDSDDSSSFVHWNIH